MGVTRAELLHSLALQRQAIADSIVLTPTDSIPFVLADRQHTAFLHGLYLSDKVRDQQAQKDAIVQFAGRGAAATDIAAIHRLFADALGAAAGSLRLLAGLQAHTATFMSIASIGQTVMLLSEEAGGHYNTHAILERLGLKTVDMPVDSEGLCINQGETMALIERVRPDFVFVDRSEGLRYEDFSFLGALDGVTTVFDCSQYLPQLLTGRYQNPIAWGFDLMLFTLHKSFPGPQKAAIVARENGRVWQRLLAGLSTLVSSSHAESSYLAGLALLRTDWLEVYCDRMLALATALEDELNNLIGVPIVSRGRQGNPTWPATQHLWIAPESKDQAFSWYQALADIGIQVNYRMLPYRLGYGLRLGTTACSVAGIGTEHAAELADLIHTALTRGAGPTLRDQVRNLARAARVQAIVPPDFWT